MTAEDLVYYAQRIESSIPIGKTIDSIIDSFKITTPYFKNNISQFTHKQLNEEELTQEFVALLRRKTIDSAFLIGQEKKDLYHHSKGRVDFYFYWKEESATTESFFDVEAKLLAQRFPKTRDKEYVIGEVENGGIERFKIEKHGKGLNQCGLLGFIEEKTPEFWIEAINNWIYDLANIDRTWNKEEKLQEIENSSGYYYLTSTVNRLTLNSLLLHHFWVL